MELEVEFCIACELKHVSDGALSSSYAIVGMIDDAKGTVNNLCALHKQLINEISTTIDNKMYKKG